MFAESFKRKKMFLRIYELANRLYMQTSTIIDEGLLQVTEKDGRIILSKSVSNTNFERITDSLPKGEYLIRLTINGNEYKRKIKV
jgi:hypothetical protein